VRGDRKDNFVLPPIFGLLSEQIFQYRDSREPGITAQRVTLGILENATDQVHFSIAQAGFMLDAALADNRLADAADILRSTDRGDFECHLQSHFALGVNTRSDIDVDADVEILELSIDQCADTTEPAGGAEGTGRDRNTISDLQRGFLVVEGANLRILNQLGVAITHQVRQRRAGNADLEIVRSQITKRVDGE